MVCQYCDEEILPDEIVEQTGFHGECIFRMVSGSAAHILGECRCYGGTREDPPAMSLRDAARLSLETWRIRRIAILGAGMVIND